MQTLKNNELEHHDLETRRIDRLSFYQMLKMKELDSKGKQLGLNRSSKQMKLYL